MSETVAFPVENMTAPSPHIGADVWAVVYRETREDAGDTTAAGLSAILRQHETMIKVTKDSSDWMEQTAVLCSIAPPAMLASHTAVLRFDFSQKKTEARCFCLILYM